MERQVTSFFVEVEQTARRLKVVVVRRGGGAEDSGMEGGGEREERERCKCPQIFFSVEVPVLQESVLEHKPLLEKTDFR